MYKSILFPDSDNSNKVIFQWSFEVLRISFVIGAVNNTSSATGIFLVSIIILVA